MNSPFSPIETQLLTGFAVALAYGIAGIGLIVAVTIFAWEAWQAAHEPDPAPPVTVTQRTHDGITTTTARVTLYVVPDPPHRPWVDDALMDWVDITDPKHDGLRCAQGHRVVRGKGVGK